MKQIKENILNNRLHLLADILLLIAVLVQAIKFNPIYLVVLLPVANLIYDSITSKEIIKENRQKYYLMVTLYEIGGLILWATLLSQ